MDALGQLSQTIATTKDAVQSERETVATQFGDVGERLPPLTAAVEAVKQAAQQLGVEY